MAEVGEPYLGSKDFIVITPNPNGLPGTRVLKCLNCNLFVSTKKFWQQEVDFDVISGSVKKPITCYHCKGIKK